MTPEEIVSQARTSYDASIKTPGKMAPVSFNRDGSFNTVSAPIEPVASVRLPAGEQSQKFKPVADDQLTMSGARTTDTLPP